ncbi:MAG: hypothetical protein Q9163_003157 [Psora crenata]
MVRTIKTIPPSINSNSRSLLLEVERSPSIPFVKPKTIQVPPGDVTMSSPIWMGDQEQIEREITEMRHKEERADAFDIQKGNIMKGTWQDRLLWRELGSTSRYASIRGIYGDKSWIDDLDIVNELGGHSGCVNALSWSSSGRLLASGSDDQHLNIHSYQADSSTSPFSLTTAVATGHTANIFSVKFMPHSNDRTLVTAAGDAEVRVFDIEYNGRVGEASMGASTASTPRSQRFQSIYKDVRYLSFGNTNARIYRSHADRVKRIVTESSPNLFLTCSEDGEVRQFDLRLPSSAYPPPRGGRGFLAHRSDHDNTNVPPPLISYKRFNLELNTISCSASQPHYIALGGSHLHCFLHDRRMLGRDMDTERGNPERAWPADSMSSTDTEIMSQATRCVRKFAPSGRNKMRRTDHGHITACKISDYNPNEMIASWSGDHIYSFDLARSPDANELSHESLRSWIAGTSKGKMKESADRKRKRKKGASTTSLEAQRKGSKLRSAGNVNLKGDMALRVDYEDRDSEHVAIKDTSPSSSSSVVGDAQESILTKLQERSLHIAKSTVKIRKFIFSLEASAANAGRSLEPAKHQASFTSALGLAASCLPEMQQISATWRYPMEPLEEDIILQQTLRRNRDSSQRFVQAAGTLARALGGTIQTASSSSNTVPNLFQEILPIQTRGLPLSKQEVFSYSFLKAIILWLEGGTTALCQGFKKPPGLRREAASYPIPHDAQAYAIHDLLIPYLLRMAGEAAIPNVDASRFERDITRKAFDTEVAAVIAFGNAIRMPLEDLSRSIMPASSSSERERVMPAAQDRETALKYWGFKVARGVLMNAGRRLNFQYVDTAFGGHGKVQIDEDKSQEDIEPHEKDEIFQSASMAEGCAWTIAADKGDGTGTSECTAQASSTSTGNMGSDLGNDDAGSDAEFILMDDLHDEIADRMAAEDERDDAEDSNDEDNNGDTDNGDDDEDITAEERSFMFRSASNRGKLREKVERDVPCHDHTRLYRGHCNVKTVKDANFFGLQDEYVVSGSDGGHVFVWDKKTTELVNILEGDSEVVNVVQGLLFTTLRASFLIRYTGHPYEPLIAVSGIDHTIKIFSADARAQEDARNGVNIDNNFHGSHGNTSLFYHNQRDPDHEQDSQHLPQGGLASRKRMQQNYQIISRNDVRRREGMRDAYITRGMLAQLAARLRARQVGVEGGAAGGVVVGEDGEAIIVDENCLVM